jgi:hypothetical protein
VLQYTERANLYGTTQNGGPQMLFATIGGHSSTDFFGFGPMEGQDAEIVVGAFRPAGLLAFLSPQCHLIQEVFRHADVPSQQLPMPL